MAAKDFIKEIADASNGEFSQKTLKAALQVIGETAADILADGEEVVLPGLGKLKPSTRPARTGRNPQTGASIQIAAKKNVKFVPGAALKAKL